VSSLVRKEQLDSELKVGEGQRPSPRDTCLFSSRLLLSWRERRTGTRHVELEDGNILRSPDSAVATAAADSSGNAHLEV